MRLIAFAAPLLATSLAFAHDHKGAHLSFLSGALHAHATWEEGPRLNQESILKLEWKNGADHSPAAAPAVVTVDVIMPGMDHEGVPTEVSSALSTTTVRGVYFLMTGDWDINVNITLAD